MHLDIKGMPKIYLGHTFFLTNSIKIRTKIIQSELLRILLHNDIIYVGVERMRYTILDK